MIDGKYEYFAFISYRWEDEKMARWLQEKLEHYKLPTSLREQNPNLPTHIRPIFRDKTDLNGHTLEESLMSALESSRYLIVVCSPLATQSDWVNRGIQKFIDLGREKDIIPFIVDGEANADAPKNECFPLALRSLKGERAIYGININDNGRDAAAVKVVSCMFDVKYDTLWNRFLLEQKRRRRYTIAGLVAAILVVAGVAGYIWTQNQELDKRNIKIETQYKELQAKNAQIEQQNKDLDAKRDSIQAANDSIKHAYERLNISEKNLAKSNADLKESNIRLAEERDNVLKANVRIKDQYTRTVISLAENSINEGNSYLARLLLHSIISENEENISDKNLTEAELVLRKAYLDNNAILKGHKRQINSLTSSFNDSILVTTSRNELRVWDTNNGALLHSEELMDECLNCVIGKSNTIIAMLTKKQIIIKNIRTGDIVRTINIKNLGGKKAIFDVNHIDNKLLLAVDTLCEEFDINTGGSIRKIAIEYESGEGYIRSGGYSPDNRYFFVATLGHISLYDSRNGIRIYRKELQHLISYLRISPQNDVFAYCDEYFNSIYIHNLQSGELIRELTTKGDGIESFDFNSKGSKITLATKQKKIITIDLAQKTEDITHDNFSECKLVKYLNTRDMFVYTTKDNEIHLIDYTNKFKNIGKHHEKYVDLSKDGSFIATADHNSSYISIWDAYSTEMLYQLKIEHKGFIGVKSLQISQDNKNILVSYSDNTIYVWDLATRQKVLLENKSKMGIVPRYSINGMYLFTMSQDGEIKIWDAKSLEVLKIIKKEGRLNSVSLSPDGEYLSYSIGGKAEIISVCTEETIFQIPTENTSRVIFSPNNQYLLTINNDYSMSLWDIYEKQVVQQFYGHSNSISFATFNENGNYLASASTDKSVIIWDTKSGKIMQHLNYRIKIQESVSFSDKNMRLVVPGDQVEMWEWYSFPKLLKINNDMYKYRKLSDEEKNIIGFE